MTLPLLLKPGPTQAFGLDPGPLTLSSCPSDVCVQAGEALIQGSEPNAKNPFSDAFLSDAGLLTRLEQDASSKPAAKAALALLLPLQHQV